MTSKAVEKVFSALNEATVRYLVAGGVAVVAYGYGRITFDVDLVIALDHDNIEAALVALQNLGYKPNIPIKLTDFAKKEIREKWVREKGMLVLRLYSDVFPETVVDVFSTIPFDFEREYARSSVYSLRQKILVPIIHIDCLMEMKKAAGRPKDLEDLNYLEKIKEIQQRDQTE